MKTEIEVTDKYNTLKAELTETEDLLLDYPNDDSMKRSRDRVRKEIYLLEWVLNLDNEI